MDMSTPDPHILRLGTRGSPLALAQAELVRAALTPFFPTIEIHVMKTSGDAQQSTPLYDIGGKGLFTKEIEEALRDRRIDIAVHSLKDVPGIIDDDLTLAAFLPRADARDAWIGPLPQGTGEGLVVGTSSPRRMVYVKKYWPGAQVVPIRGNVQTRMEKITRGDISATLLAMAGLSRLNITAGEIHPLPVTEFVPAVGQGIIAIQCRAKDATLIAALHPVTHPETEICARAERALLAALGGSCRTPIAGYAVRSGNHDFTLRAMLADETGEKILETQRRFTATDADTAGRDAAQELLARGGKNWLSSGV